MQSRVDFPTEGRQPHTEGGEEGGAGGGMWAGGPQGGSSSPPAQSAGGTMLRKAGSYAQVSGDGQIPPVLFPTASRLFNNIYPFTVVNYRALFSHPTS